MSESAGVDRAPEQFTGGTVLGGGARPPDIPFSVQINRVAGGVRVVLRGRCGGGNAGCLEHVLRDLVEGQGNHAVTLDATELVAVDGDLDHILAGVVAWATGRGTRVTVIRPRAQPGT